MKDELVEPVCLHKCQKTHKHPASKKLVVAPQASITSQGCYVGRSHLLICPSLIPTPSPTIFPVTGWAHFLTLTLSALFPHHPSYSYSFLQPTKENGQPEE